MCMKNTPITLSLFYSPIYIHLCTGFNFSFIQHSCMLWSVNKMLKARQTEIKKTGASIFYGEMSLSMLCKSCVASYATYVTMCTVTTCYANIEDFFACPWHKTTALLISLSFSLFVFTKIKVQGHMITQKVAMYNTTCTCVSYLVHVYDNAQIWVYVSNVSAKLTFIPNVLGWKTVDRTR